MKSIPKIVLTGGPCGGKSKALKYLEKQLTDLGFTAVLVKEAAESLIATDINRNSTFDFQKMIALYQLEKEAEADKYALTVEKPVIICDRGLMDCRVYLCDDDFNKMKNFLNMSESDLRDRYDAVFHLDSTASSSFYKKGNVRTENSQEAEELNFRSKKAWLDNPNYMFIPVCDTFLEKMDILMTYVKRFLQI